MVLTEKKLLQQAPWESKQLASVVTVPDSSETSRQLQDELTELRALHQDNNGPNRTEYHSNKTQFSSTESFKRNPAAQLRNSSSKPAIHGERGCTIQTSSAWLSWWLQVTHDLLPKIQLLSSQVLPGILPLIIKKETGVVYLFLQGHCQHQYQVPWGCRLIWRAAESIWTSLLLHGWL